MFFTTQEIADRLGAKLIGRGDVRVARLAHPADLANGEDLALAMDIKLVPFLEGRPVRAAVVSEGDEGHEGLKGLEALILVKRGRYAMATLTNLFERPVELPPGIHETALIEEGVEIGEGTIIGAYAYIGKGARIGPGSRLHPQTYVGPGAQIGEQALIYPGVRIGARVKIGARAILHFNASIGADGFSFVTPEMGSVESARATGAIGATNISLVRIASLGAVEIGDDVEIGANTTIDRGTIISTRIGNGTKIDNQVQVGHNVQIGDNCMICGRVGIAGSAEIGNRVVLGGAVGVADHVRIGDDSVAMAMSGVAGNLPPRSLVLGVPAKPRNAVLQQMFLQGRLRSLFEKVEKMAVRLDALDSKEKE